MPIITTYPFKKAPLNKEDEIIISDSIARGQKTRTTNIKALTEATTRLGTFVFLQSEAVTQWVVKHDLGKFPSITIVDSQPNPQTVMGNITYNDLNTCTITFGSPFSGQAFCN
jgi:hypothetical protein